MGEAGAVNPFPPAYISTGDTLATIPGQNYQYIVSEGSLISRGLGEEVHLFRMEPLGIGKSESRGPHLPGVASLSQNYPNPFNPAREIRYQLGEASSYVQLSVCDLRGRLIYTLVDREQDTGDYTVGWNGRSRTGEVLPSGIYFYVLKVQGKSGKVITLQKRKMLLLK